MSAGIKNEISIKDLNNLPANNQYKSIVLQWFASFIACLLLIILIAPEEVFPAGVSTRYYDVVWSNNQFVAVGGEGAIYTSPDGINWTERESGTDKALWAIAWNGIQFMVAGELGTILTSTDGITWEEQSPVDFFADDIVSDGNQFVTVGDCGTIGRSLDGITWDKQSLLEEPTKPSFTAITWSGSQFVVVGYFGMILTSPDAETWTWTVKSSEPDDWSTADNWREGLLQDVSWGYDQFVAVGFNTIVTSPDGETWMEQSIETAGMLEGIVWNGSQFVAVGEEGIILTSPDGKTWQEQSAGMSCDLRSISWSGDKFVVVSSCGYIIISRDGINWTEVVRPPGWRTRESGTNMNLFGIAWSGSKFVTVGETGTILTSANGKDWKERESGTDRWLNDVIWDGNQFVAVYGLAGVLFSPDGVEWTQQNSIDSSLALNSIAWNGKKYIAVGRWSSILRSHGSGEELQWFSSYNTDGPWLKGIAWGNDHFVIVGYEEDMTGLGKGYIMTTPDGIERTERHSGIGGRFLNDVAWSGNEFVVVGESGVILTSPDGINWTRQESADYSLLGVTWDGREFWAVGFGYIISSPDGVNWRQRYSTPDHELDRKYLYAVTGGGSQLTGNQIVAVGQEGTILNIDSPHKVELTITVDGQGTTVPAEGTHTFHEGTEVELKANPAEGWVLKHWLMNDEYAGSENPIVIETGQHSETETMQAVFAIKQYSLTYNAGANGSITGDTLQLVSPDENGSEVKAIPDEGYHFLSWSDGSTENPRTDANVQSDINVTAKFAINQYTVTFQDHSGFEIESQTVDHGGSATTPAEPTRDGYTFTGWDTDFGNVTGNITVTATYVANFEDGDGTADNPYILSHSDQLGQIRGNLASYFELEGDIDLDDVEDWEPIGTETDPFTGRFDGAGHVIKNLFIDDSETNNVGLFGYTKGASIQRIGIEGADITGRDNVGGLVGYAISTIISESYAEGFIKGRDNIGGLAGYLKTGSESLISDSYAGCNVNGEIAVGGIVGKLDATAAIKNTFAAGGATGESDIGGLVGLNDNGTHENIANSFWNIDVGPETSDGGTEKSTTEMMQKETFTNWDFNSIWSIKNGATYPYLQWQPAPDIDEDDDLEDSDKEKSSSSSSGCFVDTLKSGK